MRDAVRPTSKLLSIIAISFVFYWMLLGVAYSQESVAVVQALQGEANASQAGLTNETKLQKGSEIEPLSTVNTGAKSKLMLRWKQGMFTSMGESSSISSAVNSGGLGLRIQMNEGVARFTTDSEVVNPSVSYVVVTPAVSIQPEEGDQYADYTLEVRDPSTTVLTVLSGIVRASALVNGAPEEASYESCRTVHFERDKNPQVVTAYSIDLMRAMEQTMIAGSLPALDTCPAGIASGPVSGTPIVVAGQRSSRLDD